MATKTRQIKPVVKKSKIKLQFGRLLDFARPVHTSMRFPKKLKGGVIQDKEGSPRYFLFDTSAFWELLCQIDEAYEENVSDEVYQENNPVGWLIDEIETHWAWNKRALAELQREVIETQKEIKAGKTVSLAEVAKELGLVSS